MYLLRLLLQIVRWAGIVAFVMVVTQFGPQTPAMTAVYGSGFVAAVVVGFARSRPISLGVASALLAWAGVTVLRHNDQLVGATMVVGAIGGGLSLLFFRDRLAGKPPAEALPPDERHWVPEAQRRQEAAAVAAGKRVGADSLVIGTWLATLATVFSSAQLSGYAAAPSDGSGRAVDYGTFLGANFQTIMVLSAVTVAIALLGSRLRMRTWGRVAIAVLAIVVALVDTVASQIAPSTGGPFPPALPWAAVGAGLLLIGLEILEIDGFLTEPAEDRAET